MGKLKRTPIIIDTDPGIDDAVALGIALFSDELEIKLLTTVAGNVSVDKVTKNLLKLLAFWNKEIPVAMGANQPLLREAIDASDIHGKTGMEGYDFPEPKTDNLLKLHAVEAIRQVLEQSEEKVTIVPIGPLTNVALLLRLYPAMISKIEKIVLMGGSLSRGNSGVYSEFNIAVDPEAAKIVFESGIPLVMAGLDVGLKALVYPEDSEIIKDMNATGDMMYQLFKKYRGGSFKTGLKMYDSCAIAYLLKPDLFEVVDTYVAIETQGKYTSGATVVDLRGYLGDQRPNCTVCVNIDEVGFKKWFMAAIAKCE